MKRRKAFTLVEMMIGLAITGMIGACVAMMLAAASAGTRSQHDTRQFTARSQVVTEQLGELMRDGAQVLVARNEKVVIWRGDLAGNGWVNLSEIRRIEWDKHTLEVWVYEPAENLSEEDDLTYNPNADFKGVTTGVSGTWRFPGRLVAEGVVGWDLVLDEADPKEARLMRLRLTLEAESGVKDVAIVAALRREVNE